MNYKEIRNKFITFFKEKKHYNIVPAPLVNKNDPTLMFTNAGMNQFKSYFLGDEKPKHKAIVDSQPCLRVSGKHNDLEEVGLDTYHHTLFEMLGNWSFGDYFKEEAIKYAWELLTEVYKIDKKKIYVTVFAGDKKDNLEPDNEAAKIWSKYIEKERILYCSKKDNFWEMGDTGPCGPCSEIHVDIRPDEDRVKIDGKELVNKDHPQVIEIWNLVFIQYNRTSSGKLEDLPNKHIDTGMGFERLTMVLQNKKATYDTDIFKEIIDKISNDAKVSYGKDEKKDIAIRVIADHSRAITLTISEGLIPSNNQAGYVVRRILRRAIRYGYSYLNFKKPFIYKLVPIIAKQFEELIPQIMKQELFVTRVIKEEEETFIKTLSTGIKRLDQVINESETDIIDGKKVFELYDTYGFPYDLSALILKEKSKKIDEKGFQASMLKQKERSKQDATIKEDDWIIIDQTKIKSEFIGYDNYKTEAKIVKYRKIIEKGKTFYKVILNKTPFYPEGGGQVGDTGVFITNQGTQIKVLDTKKENDLIIHYIDKLPENLGENLICEIDINKRSLASKNHTATHLLHATLCSVLGSHISQKGSLVNENLLRFDFNHFSKLTKEEINKIEEIVNQKIRNNIPLDEQRNISKEEALKKSAKALFGEKYGEKVRIITFDKNFSVELCGGTHVKSTGELGYFKILSESSVAAGIRRIEAITSSKVDEFFNKNLSILDTLDELLKKPKDIVKSIEILIEENKKLKNELENINKYQAKQLKKELTDKIQLQNKINVLIEKIKISDIENLKSLAFELKRENDPIIIILAAEIKENPYIVVAFSDSIIEEFKLDASKIVKNLSKHIDGGGGGQAFFATAGGKNLQGIDKVVLEAIKLCNFI